MVLRDNYNLFDWSSKWHFEHNMIPYLEELYKTGDLVDHEPDKTRLECAQIKSIRAIYDGDRMLTEIVDEIFTEPDEELFGDVAVASYDDFMDNFIPTLSSLENSDDVVALINHKSSTARFAYGDLKNHYSPQDTDGKYISVRELVAGLRDDFMDYHGDVSPSKIGHGTKVILLTTAAKDVDAVIVKRSEYLLGPKVVHIKDGRPVRESFARYGKIEKDHDGTETYCLTIEYRDYRKPEAEQISHQTLRYDIKDGKFTLLGVSADMSDGYDVPSQSSEQMKLCGLMGGAVNDGKEFLVDERDGTLLLDSLAPVYAQSMSSGFRNSQIHW